MTILYGLAFNILWIIFLIKNIRMANQINELNQQKKQLEDRSHQLEREVRDQANKNIILESILRKQKNNNQNEDRRIY
jgi:predicted Holliday junction resolvase-like endonuclease